MRDAAVRLRNLAEELRWFDYIILEDSKTLTNNHRDFFSTNRSFIERSDNARGFGHYVWKPYFINYWLKQIKSSDLLVYLDAGCHLNGKSVESNKRFSQYLELAREHGGVSMQLKHNSFGLSDLRELSWSREDLLEYLHTIEDHANSNQVQSGIIFLIKSSATLEYSKKWYETATQDSCYFLDDSKIVQTRYKLIESRWEQSIHSILFKQFGFHMILDETTFGEEWPPDWQTLGHNFPIWAMRNRSGVNPFEFKWGDAEYRLNRRLNL
jgi:hypothetical protein